MTASGALGAGGTISVPFSADASAATLSGIRWTWQILGATCKYAGAYQGTISDAANTLTLSNTGGVTLVPGPSVCMTAPAVNGTFTFGQDISID